MKQKLILLALVIGLTIVSQSSLSLGMGKIQVYSALNEPLRSSIELITNADEELSNLEVRLASSEDYQKVGLDKSFVPSNILVNFDAENPYQINVTSNGPVSEPIVSLLLDVNWSNGRILREFTILLDPPVYETSADVQVNNVVVEPIAQDVIEEPVEQTVETTSEDTAPVLQPRETEPVETTEEVTPEPVAEAVEEVTPVVDTYDRGGSDVFVEAGDTLWSIANRNKSGDLTTHQMMMAIYNTNPSAFLNNNINQLVKGSRLTMPSADDVASIGFSEALAQVESHHQSWAPASQDYTTFQTEDSFDTTYEEPASTLDYGVQLSGGDNEGSDSGQSNADEGTATDVQALEEDLYNKDSENTELRERISELEDIVEQQQEAIVDISDDSLANLENQLGSTTDDTTDTEQVVDDIWGTTDDTTGDSDVTTGADTTDMAGDTTDDTLNLTVDTVDPVDTTVEESTGDSTTDEAASEEATTEPTGPPKFAGATEEPSMVDTAVNWVMDNLKWVLIGLVGLIVLIFLPRALRRSGGDDEDTSFLDDIKNRNKATEEEAEIEEDFGADTKMNEPLVDDEFDTTDADSDGAEDDVLAELDKSISFDESADEESEDDFMFEESEEIQEKADDGFDLDGFLNDDDDYDSDMSVTADHSETMAGAFDEDETDSEDLVEDLAEDLEALDSDDTDVEEAAEADDLEDDLFEDMDLDLDEDMSVDETIEDAVDDLSDAADDVAEDVEEVAEASLDEDDFSFDEDFDFDLDEELDEIEQAEDISMSDDDSAESADDSDDADDDFNDMLDISEDDETFEINDEEVGMDDDIDLGLEDLLEEGDAIDTKLDLAKAYIDMGDAEGAKNLLDEIVSEGTAEQVEAAKKLLDDM